MTKRSPKKRARRARSDEAKQVRRAAILKTALRLFETERYDGLTVASVAKAARIAKGTVYLYFPTKEAIFLEILLDELASWFSTLALALTAVRRGDECGVARAVAGTLGERPLLRRLLALLHPTLEQNVDAEAVVAFKRRSVELMAPIAARLEALLPYLGPHGGFRLLMHVDAVTIGVGVMSDNGAVVASVLAEPEFAPFRVDFAERLEELLVLLLRGWAR